jgi:hypothetical protein
LGTDEERKTDSGIAGAMGLGHEVAISYDSVRDKNVMQLKKLNLSIFPVNYDARYYADALASPDFTKLGTFSGNSRGARPHSVWTYLCMRMHMCL